MRVQNETPIMFWTVPRYRWKKAPFHHRVALHILSRLWPFSALFGFEILDGIKGMGPPEEWVPKGEYMTSVSASDWLV